MLNPPLVGLFSRAHAALKAREWWKPNLKTPPVKSSIDLEFEIDPDCPLIVNKRLSTLNDIVTDAFESLGYFMAGAVETKLSDADMPDRVTIGAELAAAHQFQLQLGSNSGPIAAAVDDFYQEFQRQFDRLHGRGSKRDNSKILLLNHLAINSKRLQAPESPPQQEPPDADADPAPPPPAIEKMDTKIGSLTLRDGRKVVFNGDLDQTLRAITGCFDPVHDGPLILELIDQLLEVECSARATRDAFQALIENGQSLGLI